MNVYEYIKKIYLKLKNRIYVRFFKIYEKIGYFNLLLVVQKV